MNYEEFLQPRAENANDASVESVDTVEGAISENEITDTEYLESAEEKEEQSIALNVQKAVVESLAADKAAQDEIISTLRKQNYAQQSEIATLKDKIREMRDALEKTGDLLAKNSESPLSTKVTLLERNCSVEDRFTGEIRDHVIEVLREARDAAEKEGRVRRAQILESVLVDNESSGALEKRRRALEKLFADNQNILSGPVINELDKLNISHKHGENYLLPVEIIKRTY